MFVDVLGFVFSDGTGGVGDSQDLSLCFAFCLSSKNTVAATAAADRQLCTRKQLATLMLTLCHFFNGPKRNDSDLLLMFELV